MRPAAKFGVVALGYVSAFGIAWLLLALYIAATDTVDRQGGMAAFGDGILFLAIFGVASVPATAAALFFLRPYRRFWWTLSVASLAVAITGVVAALTYAIPAAFDQTSTVAMLAPIRLLVAPLLAIFFFLSCLLATSRPSRISLLVASVMEAAAFACFVFEMIRLRTR